MKLLIWKPQLKEKSAVGRLSTRFLAYDLANRTPVPWPYAHVLSSHSS